MLNKRVQLAPLFVLLSAVGVCGAAAKDYGVRGEWTENERWCGTPDVVSIDPNKLEGMEFVCHFEGGDTSNTKHWMMKGRCSGEGEYEDGFKPPLAQIDLFVVSEMLTIRIHDTSRSDWRLAIKCK